MSARSKRIALTAALLLLGPGPARAMGSLPTGPSEKGTETEINDAVLLSDMVPAQVRLLPDREFPAALEQAILAARREVAVAVHHFEVSPERPGRPRALADLLAATARRGVEVVVVVEIGKETSFVTRDNRAAARYLVERGVRVYGDMSGTTVHANLVVIDRRLVFMGSHDFTAASLGRYREAMVAVDSPPLATAVLRFIESFEPILYRDP